MLTQMKFALLTYATRRSIWLLIGFGAVCMGPSMLLTMLGASDVRTSASSAMFAIGFPAGMVGFVLLSQAKWQFCDSRARLLPGFAAAHLTVLALIAVAVFALMPLTVAHFGELNRLGFMACAIAIAAPYIWSMHASQLLIGVSAFAAFYSLMTEAGTAFWLLPEHAGRYRAIHAAILVAGWASLAAWLRRLAVLREEMPDYQIPIQAQAGSATRMERLHGNRQIARHLLSHASTRWICDAWHNRLAHFRATSADARRRLLRYGFAPTPIELNALWVGLIFFGMFYSISQMSMMSREGSAGGALPMLTMLVIMPAMLPGQMLAGRRARVSQELLLPLSREQFINGLLGATARSTAISWVIMHVALVSLAAAISPSWITVTNVACFTVLSLAAQLLLYGCQVWFARSASGTGRMVTTMLSMLPAMLAVMLGALLLHHDLPWAALGIAAIMAAFGVLIIAKSRRAWLNAELA